MLGAFTGRLPGLAGVLATQAVYHPATREAVVRPIAGPPQ